FAENALADRDAVAVDELLREQGAWLSARRVLADLTAIDLHPQLPYRLRWRDEVDARPDEEPTWTTHGGLERIPRARPTPPARPHRPPPPLRRRPPLPRPPSRRGGTRKAARRPPPPEGPERPPRERIRRPRPQPTRRRVPPAR